MKEFIVPTEIPEVIEFYEECLVPELVRCKDCKHWEQYSDVPNIGNCPVLDQSRRADWFCGDGELKT